MKKLLTLLLGIITIFTLNSCGSIYTDMNDDVYYVDYVDGRYDINYTTIVINGTPFYYNGVISYYLYRGWYYYPYIWNGCWYFQPYRHIRPIGFIFHPTRHHQPHRHLGDIEHRHNINYGNRHFDGYRGNTGKILDNKNRRNHNNVNYHNTLKQNPSTIHREHFDSNSTGTTQRKNYTSTPQMRNQTRQSFSSGSQVRQSNSSIRSGGSKGTFSGQRK